MSSRKVWFITGAGRGMGVDFAKAALAAGHAVVASGRDTDAVSRAVGPSNDLLAVKLDVTKRADAEAAVRAAVDRFGRIDVLVNNAANFYAGYFEELTPEQFDRQLAASLIGPMNVTRAVLPVMRKQRSGRIISISSTAGLVGFEFGSAYAASKFGLEGWMAVAARRGRAVRHHHHHRQPGVLPHRTPDGAIDELRRAVHRGLRRAQSAAARVLEDPRTACNPVIPPSSRGRSSPSRARSRRRGGSSPAPTPLPPRSRWPPT